MFRTIVFALFLCGIAHSARIPGLDAIGFGFDITTGTKKLPLTQWTYNDNNQWFNPLTSETVACPDQVIVASSSEAEIIADVYWNIQEYVQAIAEEYGVATGTDLPPHAIGGASAVGKFEAIFAGGEYILAAAQHTFSLYTVASLPVEMLRLSKPFVTLVNSLPATYDEAAYKKIITHFGTHFVAEVVLGGKVIVYSEIAAGAVVHIGAQGIGQYSVEKLYNYTGVEGYSAINAGAALAAEGNVFSYASVSGGLLEKFGNYSSWVESLKSAPGAISHRLVDIAQLMDHPTKQQNMRTALNQHFASLKKSKSPAGNIPKH